MGNPEGRKRRHVAPLVVCAAGALLAAIMLAPVSATAGPDVRASAQVASAPVPRSALAAQPIITLNNNGGWCWFQDQRALFTSDDRLIVGSVPNPAGTNGPARASTVEAATYDVRTGRINVDRLHSGLGSDDHNAPAFIETRPGRVVSAWTGHAIEPAIHVASQDADSRTWDLPSPVPRPDTLAGKKVSYSDLISLSAENQGRGRLYDFYRGEAFNPNLLISDDEGRSWRYGGRLLTEADQRPYVRYSGNGVDRIDFIASQGHPSDINGLSVRAGYIRAAGCMPRTATTSARWTGRSDSPS